jgi:putative flavoprotein involved in K+ transport
MTGLYDLTVDMPKPANLKQLSCNPYVSGKNGGHTIDLRKLAEQGLQLLGHCQSVTADGTVSFADDVEENLQAADAFLATVCQEIDDYIERRGLSAPPAETQKSARTKPITTPRALRLADAGISTVIWATGFGPDFSLLPSAARDGDGRVQHRRGKTRLPGLYVIGLPWLYTLKSSLIYGITDDASYLAKDIASDLVF